jgi:hypothetical protein
MMPVRHVNESRMISALPPPAWVPATRRRDNVEAKDKSFLLLFFKKEESFFLPLRGAFFLERKKQRTFDH